MLVFCSSVRSAKENFRDRLAFASCRFAAECTGRVVVPVAAARGANPTLHRHREVRVAARCLGGGESRGGENRGRSEVEIRDSFDQMATSFALNHGVVTTPLTVATSILGSDVANTGNGTLFAFTLLSSLLLGAPLVASVGSKNGLLFALFLYCIYAACFAVAVLFGQGSSLQWFLFPLGSACGGIAAGVLWTAQGSYFSSTAAELSTVSGHPPEETTASLASRFAFVYLLLEVVSKLGFSVLQYVKVEVFVIASSYFVIGVLSLILMTSVHEFKAAEKDVNPLDKIGAAVSLWSDPVIWLLAPTNLAFGFSAAYMNGFVNGTYASAELGKSSVAFLGAVTALTAAVLSSVYGSLSSSFGKGPVIFIGAACFLGIQLCTTSLGCCTDWGWWLLALYLLQGSGRAVYESTTRAVFSDMFPGTKAEGAFANSMLQSSLAFAACFFLQTSLSSTQISTIVIVLAALTPAGYLLAQELRRRQGEYANK